MIKIEDSMPNIVSRKMGALVQPGAEKRGRQGSQAQANLSRDPARKSREKKV
jgi:hypothetical protein